MGTLGRAERPSEDMFASVDGIFAKGHSTQPRVTNTRSLRLVTEAVVEVPTNKTYGDDGQVIYPVLQTAVELGLTEAQHGQYLVAANDAIHPPAD